MLSSNLAAAQTATGALTMTDPWIRASVPGQTNGAGYLEINNHADQVISLIAVDNDRTNRVELHTVIRDGSVAKMREVKGIEVPANGQVTLKPGGFHLMFVGLKQPFKEGEVIAVTLHFSSGVTETIDFNVMAPTFTGNDPHMQHHRMKGH